MLIRRAGAVAAILTSMFVWSGQAALFAASRSNLNEVATVALESESRQCVWLRDFPPPRREIPVSVIPTGDTFAVWSATLGLLRQAVDLPLFLSTSCDVRTRITSDVTGYTITYQIYNATGVTQSLPTLQIPGNLLLPVIENLDHRVGCEWETIDASLGEQYSSRKASYPESLYAPVMVMRDPRFAVGMALQYDLLRYQHEIRTNLYRGGLGSAYAGHWTARFLLDGTIEPGQKRLYRINVYYNEYQDWIHTLHAYSKFLHTTYGDVWYSQDMRPVWMQQLGDSRRLHSGNRRGFNGARADINGFAHDVDTDLAYMSSAGYQRALIRTPAGVYFQNRQNNFPPQIMTEWTAPMEASGHEWRRLGQAGIDLYFWWGRSGQFADRWDDDVLEDFNPADPSQANVMMEEWTRAIDIGAAGLGLDKFTVLRPWAAFPWLERLWAEKPDATFVAEPVAYDLLHLRVPTLLYSEDVRRQPHLLADYLVPGREIWVLLEGEDNNLSSALSFISDGLTIVTNTQDFSANQLMDAIRAAQGCGPIGPD